jgi:hypothetical protein
VVFAGCSKSFRFDLFENKDSLFKVTFAEKAKESHAKPRRRKGLAKKTINWKTLVFSLRYLCGSASLRALLFLVPGKDSNSRKSVLPPGWNFRKGKCPRGKS